LLLKRRNAIAHGQQEFIQLDEIDDFVANVLSLMAHFRNLLENKVYTKGYIAQQALAGDARNVRA
jgi:hypothetical protein